MYDVVIKNGTIMDPKREKTTVANIAIVKDKIAYITREDIEGKEVIEAKGKIVCPGFIDIHTHVDGNKDCAEGLVAMGVTTAYSGNCGMGVENLEYFYEKYEKEGFLINQIQQVGHTALREQIGLFDRYISASSMQIEEMKLILKNLFKLGANGLSFGLEYVPGSSKEEVLELSKVAAQYGKLVSIHTRKDCYEGLTSLREAINIAKETGASIQISHLIYQYGMGMAREAIKMIEDARAEGYDISVDSGLYSGFATAIGSAVFDEGCTEKWGCNYSSIICCAGEHRGERLTKKLYEELRKKHPEYSAIGMVGNEYEVFEVLEKPYVMVASDSGTYYDNGKPGHPQDTGTFPKFFRTMVREQNRITLMDAIKRCTIIPAKRLKLHNKGSIDIGKDADIVIFDKDTIEDKSDYPCFGATDTKPEGIECVIVNGEIVVKENKILNKKPGRIIKETLEKWRWN